MVRSRSSRVTRQGKKRGEEDLCGTCGDDVGANPIGCDKCSYWFHSTQMCSSLPQDLINAIMKYGGAGVNFTCVKCRVDRTTTGGNSPSRCSDSNLAETVSQLFIQVKGMCSAIKELTSQVKTLSQISNLDHDAASKPASNSKLTTAPPPPPPTEDYRTLIREEVKEQKEREKRKTFLVVKGLAASSATDFGTKFTQLTSEFLGTQAVFTEVVPITGHRNYFRVRIPDDNNRKLLLDRAKQLKGTVHQSVYLSRDLTYAQRTELYRRRQAQQQESQAQGVTRGRDGVARQESRAGGATRSGDGEASRVPTAGPAGAAPAGDGSAVDLPQAQAQTQIPQVSPVPASVTPGPSGSGN